MAWHMPAETAPHDRTWMAFPAEGPTLGETASERDEGYATWTAVAHAVAEFEPVTMIVDPAEVARARRMLSSGIDIVEAPVDEFWMRDSGPTFVIDDERPGVLGAVDWIFNGWGAPAWAQWQKAAQHARIIAGAVGAELVSSTLVNEGGGIHVDGEGTVLLTDTVQLDPRRNPYADKARVEAEMARTLGATKAVWLPRGLTRDYDDFGTNGHVDIVATIVSPGRLLLHEQQNPEHPDHAVTRRLRAHLEQQTDAAGRRFEIVDLPAPATLRDDEGFVDWSYVNHLVTNDGVVACRFGDEQADAAARAILADVYPGRRVVTVDARPLFDRGGGIHCITQQQPSVGGSGMIDVVEASIAELRRALETGAVTAVELVDAYLARIDAYDGPETETALNAVVVRNPDARSEAAASDARRARGETLGPLDGIPYTAKDSYLVRGLTAAAGSPAFAELVARRDAFTIERLRAGGAVCLGLTNMPPMANGGMQRGVYGRAESPYNADFLTAPFASGSSNGSGTATAASFGAFGLGEETWSSGRGPATNNALCAYTPSRGVISTRGNWPLVPTMDVVVPHARTMADLLEVLGVIVADDAETRGDFWRAQPWVTLPLSSEVRPESYDALAAEAATALRGIRIGIPRMYINADPDAGTAAEPGIGGPTGQRIETRASVIERWESARRDLESAGATVIEVDFPVVSNYEGDRPGAPTIATRGLVSPEYLRREIVDLSAWGWEDFLQANGDPRLHTLAAVDGARIFPHPEGALPDRYTGFDDDIAEYPEWVRANPGIGFQDMPELADGLRGLEETRRLDLEEWMDEHELDAVVFPAAADVGPADMDVNEASADLGWRNGTWIANGNLTVRHLGIPTVTVPMGLMSDIGMPIGLTFVGRAYDDTALLRLAAGFEAIGPPGERRTPPPRTPAL